MCLPTDVCLLSGIFEYKIYLIPQSVIEKAFPNILTKALSNKAPLLSIHYILLTHCYRKCTTARTFEPMKLNKYINEWSEFTSTTRIFTHYNNISKYIFPWLLCFLHENKFRCRHFFKESSYLNVFLLLRYMLIHTYFYCESLYFNIHSIDTYIFLSTFPLLLIFCQITITYEFAMRFLHIF